MTAVRARSTLRFRPPSFEFPDALRWALLAAHGSEPPPFGAGDPLGAVRWAQRFEMDWRIGGRFPRASLAQAIGDEPARQLVAAHVLNATRMRPLALLIDELADRAEAAGIEIAFLKFAALHARGTSPLGSRRADDVDVLVAPESVDAFAALIGSAGFRTQDLPAYPHQLPPLTDAAGRTVEIHRCVPGVRVSGGGTDATLGDLRRAGLLEPMKGRTRAALPARDLLIAHLVVHGLVQHGFAPTKYAPLRLLGDLCDLGVTPDDADRVQTLLGDAVSGAEVGAVVRLTCRLAAGDRGVFDARDGGAESVLLRHLVAGIADAGYQESLRLSGVFRGRPLVPALRSALFLTNGQIDAIYGRPRRPLGYLARRLARPFDLMARGVRYGLSTVRLRR